MGCFIGYGRGNVSPRLSESEIQKLVQTTSPGLSQLELSLIVAFNALQQWVGRCGAAAGGKEFSPFELLVLHMISYGDGTKRIADVCFAVKVEDTHLVAYAIKKLTKSNLVTSTRSGKDTFFKCTESGQALLARYKEVRTRYLVRTIARLAGSDVDLDQTAETLRLLTGLYEQAARQLEIGVDQHDLPLV